MRIQTLPNLVKPILPVFAFLVVCFQADAHFELYHRIEVRIEAEGSGWVEVLIHETDLAGSGIDAYLEKNFAIRIGNNPLDAEPVVDRTGTELPDGYLSASFAFSPQVESLGFRLLSDSAKRLLLVVTRPGSFPKTRDLPPGDEFELQLR